MSVIQKFLLFSKDRTYEIFLSVSVVNFCAFAYTLISGMESKFAKTFIYLNYGGNKVEYIASKTAEYRFFSSKGRTIDEHLTNELNPCKT